MCQYDPTVYDTEEAAWNAGQELYRLGWREVWLQECDCGEDDPNSGAHWRLSGQAPYRGVH